MTTRYRGATPTAIQVGVESAAQPRWQHSVRTVAPLVPTNLPTPNAHGILAYSDHIDLIKLWERKLVNLTIKNNESDTTLYIRIGDAAPKSQLDIERGVVYVVNPQETVVVSDVELLSLGILIHVNVGVGANQVDTAFRLLTKGTSITLTGYWLEGG